MWTGNIFAGSERSKMNVWFDTSSDWLVLDSNTYDSAASITSQSTNDKTYERKYNGYVIAGTEWMDDICLDAGGKFCLSPMPFFLIEDETPLTEKFDGVMGLARSKPLETGSLAELGVKRGPSITRALKKAGLTSSDQFSFYLTSGNQGKDYIHFGEPDLNVV